MKQYQPYNPHPATKLLALIFFGMLLLHPVSDFYNVLTVGVFCIFFALNKRGATGLRLFVAYLFLVFFTNMADFSQWHPILKILLSTIVIIKIFFMPFIAGKFLIATSDVGGVITTMDALRIPQSLSIPVAVIFRFFPAYREETRHIKMAMKMRGITHRNPLRYLEYVSVPLLISSSNIAEDISRAAETKCIAEPCKKVRFTDVRFGLADVVFILAFVVIELGGRFYA